MDTCCQIGSATRGAAGNFFSIAAGVTGAAPNVEAAADPTGYSGPVRLGGGSISENSHHTLIMRKIKDDNVGDETDASKKTDIS